MPADQNHGMLYMNVLKEENRFIVLSILHFKFSIDLFPVLDLLKEFFFVRSAQRQFFFTDKDF